MELHNPAHPGEILLEYLDGMTVESASAKIGIPYSRLKLILEKKCLINSEDIQRLSKFYNTTRKFWINLNNEYTRFSIKKDEEKNTSTPELLDGFTQVGQELPFNNAWYKLRVLSDLSENAISNFIVAYHHDGIFYRMSISKTDIRESGLKVIDKPITHFKLMHLEDNNHE